MAKATVLAQFEDVEQAMMSDAIVEMEYNLLIMQFEKYFRDTYNEEKFVKYGFKQEKRVLRIIDDQCKGMFKMFLSQKLSKKEKSKLSL